MVFCYTCGQNLHHNACNQACLGMQALRSPSLSTHHRFHPHVATGTHSSLDRFASMRQNYLIGSPSPNKYSPSSTLNYSMPGPSRNVTLSHSLHPSVPQPLQGHLRDVLNSDWYHNNHLEPNDELLTFIRVINRNRFQCRVIGCERLFSRRERAVNHFRSEINHRPFVCTDGACGDNSCTLGFFSQRDLQSHIIKPVVDCSRCGRQVTARNVVRHQKSTKCRKANG